MKKRGVDSGSDVTDSMAVGLQQRCDGRGWVGCQIGGFILCGYDRLDVGHKHARLAAPTRDNAEATASLRSALEMD